MHYVYILYSIKCQRFYVGYSTDVAARLARHNKGMVTATKDCTPYELKAFKAFNSAIEAKQEEYKIKKMKSRKYIEFLVAGNW